MILRASIGLLIFFLVQRADSSFVDSIKKEMEGVRDELVMKMISGSMELEAIVKDVRNAKAGGVIQLNWNGCTELSESFAAGEKIIADVPRIALGVIKNFTHEIETFLQCVGFNPFKAVKCFRETYLREFSEETKESILDYQKTVKSCTNIIRLHFATCLGMIPVETTTSRAEEFEELSRFLLNKIKDYLKDMETKLIKESGIVKKAMDAIQSELKIKNFNLNDCHELSVSLNDAKEEIGGISSDLQFFSNTSDEYINDIYKCNDSADSQLLTCIKNQENKWVIWSGLLAKTVQDHVKKVQELVKEIPENLGKCSKPTPPTPSPSNYDPNYNWNHNWNPQPSRNDDNDRNNALDLGLGLGGVIAGKGLAGAALGALEGAEGGPVGVVIGGILGGLVG